MVPLLHSHQRRKQLGVVASCNIIMCLFNTYFKRGAARTAFRRRWFVLTKHALSYWLTEEDHVCAIWVPYVIYPLPIYRIYPHIYL
jgi:hypothetical protein